MSQLSANWKRLQSKIAPKGSIKKRKVKKLVPGTSPTKQTKEEEQTSKPSAFQSTLWIKDNDINISDVAEHKLVITKSDSKKTEPGKYLAIDCEFVGVGPEGEESALARVSIVNFYGHVIYDKFVKPREKVTDWRTWVSGVTPKHMNEAIPFKEAQEETANLLKGRILVGHAVHHDLDALFLSHAKSMIRDTTSFKPFRAISNGRTPSLKKLTKHFLQLDIQGSAHSSVEDARATMLLFRMHRKDFEATLRKKSS